MHRRDFLRRASATTAGLALVGTAPPARAQPVTFAHGVASGDPLADVVVLWTRVSGATGATSVRWTVARDEGFGDVAASGEAVAAPEADSTVHAEATGLEPATTYWYRFHVGDVVSPVGRTRTARASDDPGEVRVGVVSCSSYAADSFAAYSRLAERDVDLVVHLGDFIYADDTGEVRPAEPPGTVSTLDGYRARHASYRTDADLLQLLAAQPLAAMWDDNDVADSAWAEGASGTDEGAWPQRRADGLRAWVEWLPIRLPDPARPERVWRALPLGGAAELVLLDTRHDGRDRQVSGDDADPATAVSDGGRRMFSDEQRDFVAGRLRTSTAAWRVLGNQVVLSPLGIDLPGPLEALGRNVGVVVGEEVINPDGWDGYRAERERLLEVVAERRGEVVVLTGDVHSSWAFEVPGPGPVGSEGDDAPVAVELVTPSVSAPAFAELLRADAAVVAAPLVELVQAQLPSVRWAELQSHGYVVVALDPERMQADWWHVDPAERVEARAASWSAVRGEPRLTELAEGLGPRRATPEVPAPVPGTTPDPEIADDPVVNGPMAILGAGLVAVAVGGVIALRRRRSDD